MVEAAEHLTRIRAELAGDLAEIEEQLTQARADAREAETVLQGAIAEWRSLEQLTVRGGDTAHYTALASPLHAKLLEIRDGLIKPPERARARARARVGSLEHQRGTLLDSLEQIDRALRGDRNGVVTRLPPAPKRLAPIVEFSDVELLRGESAR
jgi:hypothetical protein